MIATLALLVAAASSDTTAIYRAALKQLATLPQPAFIDTTDHWKVLASTAQGSQVSQFDERVLFDSTARRECVLFMPYTPTSFTIIGPSYFAPDLWLVHQRAAAQTPPPTQTPSPSSSPAGYARQAEQEQNFTPDLADLKTIANVVSVGKPSYKIHFAGVTPLTHGGSAYHLLLDPIGNPAKHNLRELWVNAATSNIVRAVLVGDYRPDAHSLLEQTTVEEDFGKVGPYWMMIHHTWTYRDAMNSVNYQYDVTAATMSFPAQIPAWYFDELQFNNHRAEVNTTGRWP